MLLSVRTLRQFALPIVKGHKGRAEIGELFFTPMPNSITRHLGINLLASGGGATFDALDVFKALLPLAGGIYPYHWKAFTSLCNSRDFVLNSILI
jgi:hypothetical protein